MGTHVFSEVSQLLELPYAERPHEATQWTITGTFGSTGRGLDSLTSHPFRLLPLRRRLVLAAALVLVLTGVGTAFAVGARPGDLDAFSGT